MASHLFLWAGLICVQCVAKGARAFFCEPFKLCQDELAVIVGGADVPADELTALACVAWASALVTAVNRTTARQLTKKG